MSTQTLNPSLESISQRLLAGDRRALAKAISIVEDGGPAAEALVRNLHTHAGKAHLVGITGPPGVGKSTLVDSLVSQMRQSDLQVGVIAIDPSSPFSGGAILGDRIRMQAHTLDKNVFIRSMANRGHSGGTALAIYDAVRMMEASGCQVVIIETVGVGQSELAIAQTADTTVLVLMPGSGDDVQAIKSGIMEIGDIFVVNKGDLPGANKTAAEIMQSLELSSKTNGWKAPVHVTNAETDTGVDAVWQSIAEHKRYLDSSGDLTRRREFRAESELSELVASLARERMKEALASSSKLKSTLSRLVTHEIDPHSAANSVIDDIFRSERDGGNEK